MLCPLHKYPDAQEEKDMMALGHLTEKWCKEDGGQDNNTFSNCFMLGNCIKALE